MRTLVLFAASFQDQSSLIPNPFRTHFQSIPVSFPGHSTVFFQVETSCFKSVNHVSQSGCRIPKFFNLIGSCSCNPEYLEKRSASFHPSLLRTPRPLWSQFQSILASFPGDFIINLLLTIKSCVARWRLTPLWLAPGPQGQTRRGAT